jgi:hypothetical protein
MAEEVYVRVPRDLAKELDRDGIEELERVRSLDWLAPTATIAVMLVGAGADLTTVLLARDSLAQFANRLFTWARRRSQEASGSVLTVHIDVKATGDNSLRRSLDLKFSSTDETPQIDTEALLPILRAAFAGRDTVG